MSSRRRRRPGARPSISSAREAPTGDSFESECGTRGAACAPRPRASPTGSITRRLDFVNPIAANPEFRMVLLDCLPVRGLEDAVQLVLRLAEQDVVVRDAELVRGRRLRGAELV